MLEILLLYSLCVLVSSAPTIPTIYSQPYLMNPQNDYRIPTSNPTNDFKPSYPQNPAQNALALDFTQILLKKLLSRPSLQAILDPNARNYGLNEMPTPTVVNNYIILPMECPNVNKTDGDQDISLNKVKNVEANTISSKNGTKKKSRRKPRNEQDRTKLERDKNILKSDDIELRTTIPKKPRKITENKSNTINNGNEKISNRDGRKRKQRQNDLSEIKQNIINNDDNTELNISTQKPRRRKKNTANNSTKDDKQINNTTLPNVAHTYNTIKKPIKLVESEKNQNAVKNDVDNNFLKMFPNIPVDMAKNFMTGMNQFNNPQLNSFFGNYGQFYQSLVSGTQESNKRTTKRRKLKTNRRNRKKNHKNKPQNENHVAKSNKTPVYVTTNPSKSVNVGSVANSTRHEVKVNLIGLTTKSTDVADMKTQPDIINLKLKPVTEATKNIKKTPFAKIPAIINIDDHFDELDVTDDADDIEFDTPSVYYGIIEDYYPLFTDNAAYANNNRLVKSLDSERLFYTSDGIKGFIDDEYIELNDNDPEINTDTSDSIVVNTDRNIKEVELQFRQPPSLDLPDFLTRKVESSEIKSKQFEDNIDMNDRVYVPDFNDKYSSYSNAKTTNLGGLKKAKSKLNNAVETVYARSKVVKYGQKEDSEEEEEGVDAEGSWESFQNDGTTYIVAKSLDSGELW